MKVTQSSFDIAVSICVFALVLALPKAHAQHTSGTGNAEQIEKIDTCLQQLFASKTLKDRYPLLTERGKYNSTASVLFRHVRRGLAPEVQELLLKYEIRDLEIPPVATREMPVEELQRLRIGQWLFMKQLFEQLGEKAGVFSEELHEIELMEFRPEAELKSHTFNEEKMEVTAELYLNGNKDSNVRFKLDGDQWLYDGRANSVYLELNPRGLLHENQQELSPVLVRDLVAAGKVDEAIELLDHALAAEPSNPIWLKLRDMLRSYVGE